MQHQSHEKANNRLESAHVEDFDPLAEQAGTKIPSNLRSQSGKSIHALFLCRTAPVVDSEQRDEPVRALRGRPEFGGILL